MFRFFHTVLCLEKLIIIIIDMQLLNVIFCIRTWNQIPNWA